MNPSRTILKFLIQVGASERLATVLCLLTVVSFCEDEKEQPINISTEYRPEHYSNGPGEGNNRRETFLTEIESAEIQINGKTPKSEAATISYTDFRTIGDCRSSNISTTDCTTQCELYSSKTIISNCIEVNNIDV